MNPMWWFPPATADDIDSDGLNLNLLYVCLYQIWFIWVWLLLFFRLSDICWYCFTLTIQFTVISS